MPANEIHALEINFSRPFPLTKDIVDIIKTVNKLDFVIVSQFNEGVGISPQDVRIYEPNNMNSSIEKQRIDVYDRVFYTKVKRNISLNLNNETEVFVFLIDRNSMNAADYNIHLIHQPPSTLVQPSTIIILNKLSSLSTIAFPTKSL